MRRQTEISLLKKQTHLYHSSILKAYDIPFENETILKYENYGFRRGFKESNFFECGEGWLTIIAAFGQSIDQIQFEYAVSINDENKESEVNSVLINGAVTHQYRLWITVDTPSNTDEVFLKKVKLMQDFAKFMSGYICEICGVPVKESDLNTHVKCVICRCRDD